MDDAFLAEPTQRRRRLHAHPELSGQEEGTARFVQARLRAPGMPFEAGVGRRGVVATLSRPGSNRAAGLRADMDALPIHERNESAHASTRPGVMHACGHDGHTVPLLAAAAALAADPDWKGTVRFIFQPSEENGEGARAMIADGLFERFSVEREFGLHNPPGLPECGVAVHGGPAMAAGGRFSVTLPGSAATPRRRIRRAIGSSRGRNSCWARKEIALKGVFQRERAGPGGQTGSGGASQRSVPDPRPAADDALPEAPRRGGRPGSGGRAPPFGQPFLKRLFPMRAIFMRPMGLGRSARAASRRR